MPSVYDLVPPPKRIQGLPMIGKMPVPYTTKYADPETGEAPEYIAKDSYGHPVQGCDCVFGEGKALLGNPCPHRQRKAMTERRCVNCGRAIGDKTEMVFIGVAHKNLGSQGKPYSIEPPSHAECAAYAMLVCPRLIANSDKVTVALARKYLLCAQIGSVDPDAYPSSSRLAPLDERLPFGLVVELYAAIPDPAASVYMPLTEWMNTRAPRRYRDLFASGAWHDLARPS